MVRSTLSRLGLGLAGMAIVLISTGCAARLGPPPVHHQANAVHAPGKPHPHAVWVKGHYAYQHGKYHWVPGHWKQPR